MTKGFIYTLLSILLFNIANSQESIKPQIKFLRNVDPCSSDKYFEFVVDIGEISKTDNFYGLDYSIQYDSSKVSFENAAFMNTQMEKFTYKFNNNDRDRQEIYGSGGVIGSSPLSGTGMLFGASFQYIADDFSSATFRINYINMTDEYSKNIDLTNNTFTFTPIITDKEERKISISDNLSNLNIDSNYSLNAELDFQVYNDNRLDSFDFVLTYDKNIFDVSLVQNENFSFDELNSNEYSKYYRIKKVSNFSNLSSLKLNLIQNPDYNEIAKFGINYAIKDWDKASCVTRASKNDGFEIQTFEKTITSVKEYLNINENIKVYNMLGIEVDNIKKVKDMNNLKNGFYIIQYQNKIEKIIIN